MTISRTLPTTASTPPVTGPDYMDAAAESVAGLWNAAALRLTSIGGTANAITAALAPPLTAGIVDGMKLELIPAADNTGPVTLAINGASPVAVVDDDGDALAAGQLVAGRVFLLLAEGGELRVLGSSTFARVADYQVFDASGTWTKPLGTPDDAVVIVEAWGAGGGGSNNTSSNSAASGGGGGQYAMRILRAGDLASTVAVTVPAGGAAGAAGSPASFGSHLVAYGGGGGAGVASNNSRVASGGGGGGHFGTGGNGVANSTNGTSTSAAAGAAGDMLAGAGGVATYSDPTASGSAGGEGYFGGGGGGGCGRTSAGAGSGALGGRSVHGGAGGSARYASGNAVSIYGGDGGAASSPGGPRGGGGGYNAAGGRGEVRIRVVG